MSSNYQISEREREILRLIATGATNQQIANSLSISVNTVKVHVRNIFGKISVASRAEAAMYAVRTGLVRLEDSSASPGNGSVDVLLPADPEATAEQEEGERPLVPESEPSEPGVAAPRLPQPAVVVLRQRPLVLWGLVIAVSAIAVVMLFTLGVIPRPGAEPTPMPTITTQAAQRWRELPSLPSGLAAFGLATYAYDGRSFLYALGGEQSSTALDQVLRYDVASSVWVTMSRKPTAVTDVRAVTIGGRIYVPGGLTASGSATDALEAYDPQHDHWQALAPMPAPRSGYALASVEGKLYVIGGWDGSSYRADVWQYNPDNDTWRAEAAMPTARSHAAVAAVEQHIYVIGGESDQGSLTVNQRYSPALDRDGASAWSTQAPAAGPISGSDAAVAGGLVMIVGSDSATGRLLVYSPQTDSWESSLIPVPPLRDLRMQAIGGRLYIVGGRGNGTTSGRVYQYQAISTVFLPALP